MEPVKVSMKSRVHNGHNIRNIRREKGLQHAALEKLLGMTTQQLIAIENEEVVDNETLEKFAKVLDVPVEEFTETEEERPCVIFENNTFNNEGEGIQNIQPLAEVETFNNENEGENSPVYQTEGNVEQNGFQYGYTEEFMEEYQSHVRNMLKIQEHFEKQLENRCNTLEDMVDTLKTQIQTQNEQIKALLQALKK